VRDGYGRDGDGALRLDPREQHLLRRDLLALGDGGDDTADGTFNASERAARSKRDGVSSAWEREGG
jgi:hypothetical protein